MFKEEQLCDTILSFYSFAVRKNIVFSYFSVSQKQVTPEQRDLLTETSIGQPKKKTKTKHTKEINECAIMDKSKTGGRDGEELTMDTVNLM